MESAESDAGYLEVKAVFNEKPTKQLLERSIRTGLRRTSQKVVLVYR